jgi:hypothetical protein
VSDVDVTELAVLDADSVAGVGKGASGTPFLLIKAASGASKETCPSARGPGL